MSEKSSVQIASYILPVIVFSQFAGTSLWFAGNAIVGDLQDTLNLGSHALGLLTSAVQLGFIAGTLMFAFFTIADRFSPRKIFFICALSGALSNLMLLIATGLYSLLLFRFLTGFFLAGIYPVGMKIAAGWYQKGLGKALGFLVGALVLGTAFPHLLKSFDKVLPWKGATLMISLLAMIGGILVLIYVPDGPYIKKGVKFDPRTLGQLFRYPDFRAAALGYFGHMWELYTFWAFVPYFLEAYRQAQPSLSFSVPLWSFGTIAIGALACVWGGIISLKSGSSKVALYTLLISGICCILSPWIFYLPYYLFFPFLLIWGMAVITDSAQFSTLTAQSAPAHLIGTGLTIVTSMGFALTIVSIQLVTFLLEYISPNFIFIGLAIGPLGGIIGFWPFFRKEA